MKRKKSSIGIREIAHIAGVSTATVSRVINKESNTSPEMRERVQKVIEEYGYVPNLNAKNMKHQSSRSIAIFIYDMNNPFYISVMQYLNKLAFENDYTLIICEAGNHFERQRKYYQYCKGIQVSGIIFTESRINDPFALDGHDEIPVALLDRVSFPGKDCYEVQFDARQGMQLLIEHLINLNHKKIGFICGPDYMLSANKRKKFFLSLMKEKGLEVPESYLFKTDAFSEINGLHAYDYFSQIEPLPTAIIAGNDQLARGFIMRAHMRGANIPEQFSVCGVDAIENSIFFPKITSYKQDTEMVAREMMSFLLNAKNVPPPQTKILDVTLSPGQTCRRI
ncbi:MAG: LacI family DNA-binding transcriptional regulator [Christensenellales bacterium]|jgi:DNA-binding LacI/PurR family transcriptional regulator